MYLCTPDQLFCLLHILHVTYYTEAKNILFFVVLILLQHPCGVCNNVCYVYHVSYCDPMLLVLSNYFLMDESLISIIFDTPNFVISYQLNFLQVEQITTVNVTLAKQFFFSFHNQDLQKLKFPFIFL